MRSRLDLFQRFALVTTFVTYLLIAVGGLVRASGSGLGCPDWPKCFGRWIPPTTAADVPASIDPALFNFAKAWTEYVNRLLGVSTGLLIFGTLVLAIIHHRRSPRILWPTALAFVLVGLEGWIGGRVVASKLSPIVLTVHLVFALLVVSALLYATFSAFFPGGRRTEVLTPDRRALARASVAVLGLALVQLGIGAALRGEVQLASRGDLPRSAWIAGAGALEAVHRAFAGGVSLSVLGLFLWSEKRAPSDARLRHALVTSLAIVGLQVAAGIGLERFELPPVLQVVHLTLGALLLGALTLVALVALRLDPRDASAQPRGGVPSAEPVDGLPRALTR